MNLNITFDLETCALCPTAAVMSIGAVAWNADAEDNPFTEGFSGDYCFYRHVDLRSSFVDGFTFDGKTSEWWATQDEDAKKALLEYDDVPLRSIDGVIEDFFSFIQHVQEETSAKNVKLWSQGTDFDIAILRNICGNMASECLSATRTSVTTARSSWREQRLSLTRQTQNWTMSIRLLRWLSNTTVLVNHTILSLIANVVSFIPGR